jgi:hypothetical protein
MGLILSLSKDEAIKIDPLSDAGLKPSKRCYSLR